MSGKVAMISIVVIASSWHRLTEELNICAVHCLHTFVGRFGTPLGFPSPETGFHQR